MDNGDNWNAVLNQLILTAILEWRAYEANNTPKTATAGKSCAGAKLMAWRLLSRGIEPNIQLTRNTK